ncbi:MAG: helix-turn-helix domain-containing protein [Ilumatobacteraceae bacterium]
MSNSTIVEERSPADLSPLVRCTYVARFDGDPYQLYPDGCIDLVATGDGLVVCGPETRGWSFQVAAGSTSVGLRFEPAAFTAVFGERADALLDRRIPLDGLVGSRTARVLGERLGGAPSPDHRRHLLTDFVRATQPGSWRGRCTPEPTAGALVTAPPGIDIADIARELGVSRRQLHRVAVRTLGYGPSMVRRVMRTQRALAAMRSAVPMTLAEIAVVSGFADQSHMTREFRDICATTPAVARRSRPDGGRGTDVVTPASDADR